MLDRPQVHRTAGSDWASPRRAPQAGRQLAGQFPHRAPQHVGHACQVRGSVALLVVPGARDGTAAGTSGCRVLMVTHAASSAVITWRHDGIGTRRLHRPLFKTRRHGNGELSHNDARPWMLVAEHRARPRRSSRYCLLIQAQPAGLRAEVVASVPATGGWWRQRGRLERLQRCRQQGRS